MYMFVYIIQCSPQDCRKKEGLINIHTNYVIHASLSLFVLYVVVCICCAVVCAFMCGVMGVLSNIVL